MKTAAEIEAAFRADLQALLDRYSAEMEVDTDRLGNPELTVSVAGIYDGPEADRREGALFTLDNYLYPTERK